MNPIPTKIVPVSRIPVTIRDAMVADIPFIDALQKMHSKQVGWMPTRQLEGKINAGHVIIAESDQPIGYCIGNDQYFKRDDVGIIYQLNVVPGHQRSLVGATLVKALFDRAAYGCRLFCCWCAQDIEANRFWESIGFIPLAFRAGSEKKGRVHIFWEKRIRQGDETTPWWFPSKTGGGSIREDRIVLPIPPGTHWSEVRAAILPGLDEHTRRKGDQRQDAKALPGPRGTKNAATKRPAIPRLGTSFSIPLPGETVKAETPKPGKRPRRTHDPKLVSAARELRDRWLEHVSANPTALTGAGKYDVIKQCGAPTSTLGEMRLEAA